MQCHRGLRSIRKWELSLGVLSVCPSLAEKCPEGSADHLIHAFTLRHLLMHCTEFKQSFNLSHSFLIYYKHKILSKKCIFFLFWIHSSLCIIVADRQEHEWGVSDHIFPVDILCSCAFLLCD